MVELFKFFGAALVGSAAFGVASVITLPLLIASVVISAAHGIELFWPWIVVLVIYGLGAALIVRALKDTGLQGFATVVASVAPVLQVLRSSHSTKWLLWLTVALVWAAAFAASAGACERKKIQLLGALVAIQILWLAPLTLAVYQNYTSAPEVWSILAFLVGVIGAIVGGSGVYDELLRP